jgi:hypothetical protein
MTATGAAKRKLVIPKKLSGINTGVVELRIGPVIEFDRRFT